MDKPKTGILAGIRKYGKNYLYAMIVAALMAVVGNIATLLGPNQLSRITNLISKGLRGSIDLQAIGQIVLVLAIIYAVGAIMSYGQGYIMATVSQAFTRDLRNNVSHKINRLPLTYFDEHDEGDTLSRVTNDLDTFGQSLNQSLGTLISSVVLIVGSIIMMTYTNWILSLTAVVSAVLGMTITVLLLRKSQGYFTSQQQQLAEVSGYVEEIYSGHEVVKLYNDTDNAVKTFTSLNTKLYNSVWKSQFLSGIMQPLMTFIGNFGYVAVSVVGALLVLNGTASIGVIVAFMVFVRIFTQPLSQITQAFSSLQSAQAAFRRVLDFLDEDEASTDEQGVATIERASGKIDFDHVNFEYEPGEPIIKDFSAHVKPGQKVAIVGPTGAGKTTLISLLMKFYQYQGGTIKLDDQDIANLSAANVRSQFDMVLQDAWL